MKNIIIMAIAILATLVIIDVASAAEPNVIDASGAVVEAGSRERQPLNWHDVYGTDDGLECEECSND